MSKKEVKKKKIDGMTLTFGLVILIFLGLGAFGIISHFAGGGSTKVQTEATGPSDLTLDKQPVQGQETAPVSIVEFADFKCPYCKQWESDIYPQLKADYIDTGKVKLYFKNLAFIGPDSTTAAIAGEAIYNQNPEAFWKYYDLMFKNQQDESKQWATKDFITDLVKKNIEGIDVDKLSKDMSDKANSSEVQKDILEASKAGIQSTPSLVINGTVAANPFDYDALKELIDKQIGAADAQK